MIEASRCRCRALLGREARLAANVVRSHHPGTTPTVLAVALLAASVVAAASAAPRSLASGVGASKGFCSAASWAKGSFSLNGTGSYLGVSAGALRAEAAALRRDQSTLLASAPGQIRSDLQKLFALDTTFFQDLAKVNYNVSKVGALVLLRLMTDGLELKPEANQTISYLNKSCGLNLTSLP